MTDLLSTVTIPATSGLAKDSIVNTFAMKADVAVDAAVILDWHNALSNFYNGLSAGQGVTVGAYLASTMSRVASACRIKTYDITGKLQASVPAGSPPGTKPRPPAHGSPIAEDGFTLPAPDTTTNLAPQVQTVITLRGRDALEQPVEGADNIRPRQRRSGRLFIGPLNASAQSAVANQITRPSATFRDNLMRACEGLQDQLVDGDYIWCVWSRSAGSLFGIERVEVDDSFDVLRSRKAAPTVRNSFVFAPEPAPVLGA